MRWFKHLSIANRDESLCQLRDEFGLEGYGAYWMILERIAEKITPEMDQESQIFLQLSEKNWRNFLGFSPKKFQKFIEFCEKISLFSQKNDKKNSNLITIHFPKLLKYRDEFTKKKIKNPESLRSHSGVTPESLQKKSGVTPESLQKKSGVTPEQDRDTDTDTDTEIHQRKVKESKGKKNKERKRTIYPPDVIEFCKDYIRGILQSKGKLAPKDTETTLKNSCTVVDLLIRQDGFNLEYIKKVLRWAYRDNFWSNNTLSLAQLRKQNKDDTLTKFQKIANSYEASLMAGLKKIKTPAEKYEEEHNQRLRELEQLQKESDAKKAKRQKEEEERKKEESIRRRQEIEQQKQAEKEWKEKYGNPNL